MAKSTEYPPVNDGEGSKAVKQEALASTDTSLAALSDSSVPTFQLVKQLLSGKDDVTSTGVARNWCYTGVCTSVIG